MLRSMLSCFSRKKLCLIADDSAAIRASARSILKELDFHTAEAEDGLDALSKCRETRPDAILLDQTMPYLSGMGVMAALREGGVGRSPKIIFCTTERNPREIARAIDAGAHEYLIKPFDRSLLAAKLARLGLTA